jgi:hypothetical protein
MPAPPPLDRGAQISATPEPSGLLRARRRLMGHFRRRRLDQFLARVGIDETTRVLDVGGTPHLWQLMPLRPRVTLLNQMSTPPWPLPPGFAYVQGDGCNLPYADREYDLVFSNSVIEHVGARDRQETFAREVRRVGRGYYVQTPNRNFPIESHLWGLNVFLAPPRWRPVMLRVLTYWGWVHRPTRDGIASRLAGINLLDERLMLELFSDGTVIRERVAGLTKSLAVYRPIE